MGTEGRAADVAAGVPEDVAENAAEDDPAEVGCEAFGESDADDEFDKSTRDVAMREAAAEFAASEFLGGAVTG